MPDRTSRKVEFFQKTIDKALRDAAAGQSYDLTDTKGEGLVLRVAPRGVKWAWRKKVRASTWRLDLGRVDGMSLAVARKIADGASKASRTQIRKLDADFVDQSIDALRRDEERARRWDAMNIQANGGKLDPRFLPREPVDVPVSRSEITVARGMWTFAEGRQAYLAEVARTRASATHNDYTNKLSKPELRTLDYRPLGGITRREVAEIVATIHRSGREREAEHVASVVRPMWRWLAQDSQIGSSGVKPECMVGLAAPARSEVDVDLEDQPGTYCPPVEEIGRILAVARSGALDPTVATAFELLIGMVQRRRAIAAARIADFESDGEGGGLWTVPRGDRKGMQRRRRGKKVVKRHVLPLFPALWARISAQILRVRQNPRTAGSLWLFPQFRPRRVGGPSKGHMSDANLNHRLLDMAKLGVTASPHDLRRAFTTYSEDLHGMMLGDIDLILDHDEGYDASDTSDSAYSQALRLARKRRVLEPWLELLDREAMKAAISLPPREEIVTVLVAARNARNQAKAGRRRGDHDQGIRAA